MFRIVSGVVAATAAVALPSAAHAAVNVQFLEVGGNVIATTTGSFDPTGLFQGGQNNYGGGVNGDLAAFDTTDGFARAYYGLSGPAAFGSDSVFFRSATTFTGTFFGFLGAGGEVRLEDSYLAGSPIVATTTWLNASFASLHLTTGVYEYTAPSDTITVSIGSGVAAVPEPATWAMLLLGFGVIGGAIRRRRSQSAFGETAVRYA